MDDLSHVKPKKKVTFGKAKVRLLFDYHDEDSFQNDADEKTSREIAKMKETPPQTQIQPKSILKRTKKAVSVDRGLNTLHSVPKRSLEWEKIDRNFWTPATRNRIVGRKQISRSESNISHTQNVKGDKVLEKRNRVKEELSISNETYQNIKVSEKQSTERHTKNQAQNRHSKSKSEFLKQADKSVSKQNESNFLAKDELVSSPLENENDMRPREKQGIKNNEKWEGFTIHTNGLKDFVGIYSGVEADWDQTKQALSRIGVEVGEERLQDPREFVTIMNMFLSKQSEKSDNQSSLQNEQRNMVESSAELHYNKDESRSGQENYYDLNSSGGIAGKHTSTPEIVDMKPQEEAMAMDTNDNTTHKCEKPPPSKEELKKRIKKLRMKGLMPGKNTTTKIGKNRSHTISDHNLNYLPTPDCKVNDEKHSTFDRIRSGNEVDSPKSGKDIRQRSYSENNLDIFSHFESEERKYESTSTEDVNCDTEVECSSTDNDTNRNRSYSDINLTMARKSMNISSGRERSSSCVKDEGGSQHGEDLQHKKNRERPKLVKRDSWFLIKKQKLKSDSGPNLNEIENPGVERVGKRGCSSERKLDSVTQSRTSDEGQDSSVPGSDLDNKSSTLKNHQESTDGPSTQHKVTLLMISNQSGSEKEDSERGATNDPDSGLSSASGDNTNGQEYETKNTTNTVDNQNENLRSKPSTSKQTSSQDELKDTDSQNTTPVAECNPSLANDQRLQIIEVSQLEDTAQASRVKEIERNRPIECQRKPVFTRENKKEPRTLAEEDCIYRNNHESCQDELMLENQFQNDINFIVAESTKTLKSEAYIQKAKKRHSPKQQRSGFEINLKKKSVLIIVEAINKNPAAGVFSLFLKE